MALKYYLEYNDVKNVTHELELYDDDFTGSSTEIYGTVFYDFANSDNLLECIKGSGLSVQLEANSSLTFSDLFSEEERQIKVIYIRDSITKFVGWLNPEGWYEDFVVDKWIVTFDVVDGLSYLENLSYVDNSTGLLFTGKQTQLEVIVNCLVRTGLQLNINTDIDIEYTGLGTTVDVLDNVYVNAQRFIKDDGDTIMDCDKVLKSILEPYAACITMYNGEWFIYKPNQLYSSASMTYYRYDYLGAALTPTTGTLDTSFSLGSEIDGYYPHHANSNQSISNNKSLGALRINYKYGFLKGLINNVYFVTEDGTTYDEWTINNATYVTVPSAGEAGVTIDAVEYGSKTIVLTSDVIDNLDAGITLDLDLRFKATQGLDYPISLPIKIVLTGTTTTYYLDINGMWQTSDTFIDSEYITNELLEYSINIQAQALPESGDIYLYVYTPETADFPSGSPPGTGDGLVLSLFSLTNENQQGGNVQGEYHTFERSTNPSSKIEEVIEVAQGDNASDAYMGTIYTSNETTPTGSWNRHGVTESIPIIRLMGEEILRLNQSTARVFSGSVFGFFDFLSTVTINGFTGVFVPTKYSYDTKNNLISAEFKQIFGAELTDIDYESAYDYGNVVKPTIKG